jgi:anti-anti-sigma regulatory factor
VLLIGAKKMMASGGKLVLCAAQMTVKEVFDISGFLSIPAYYDSRQEAVAAMT